MLVFEIGYALLIATLLLLAGSTLAWMLYGWAQAGSVADPHDGGDGGSDIALLPGAGLSFSLLVPARHEQDVLAATLDRLAAVQHDDFEIVVIVGHDDPDTAAIARESAARHPDRVKVVVDDNPVKNKPKALNRGLAVARGDVVGVFDAEDVVHPGLLAAVERQMITRQCAALQSGVQLMNFWSSWFSVRNVLEYYFWFRSRLHFQAAQGFIPLGGNTVFVRRSLLEMIGGWDEECLAEDCDLGVRLSVRGFQVAVSYDAELVTREETPGSISEFVRQRTRWNQGFLQVLLKGEWRRLPQRRQRTLALYTLCTPLIQACTGVILPFAVIMWAVGNLPVFLALLSFLPILPTLTTVTIEHAALYEFGSLYDVRVRLRDHLRLLLSTPVFQAVLAYAAIRAVVRQIRGRGGWEKTAHLGRHLELAVEPNEAVA